MTERFDKDAWILRAISREAYIATKDGSVFRIFAKPHFRGSRGFEISVAEVTLSTHAKTGRVYFNMTFEGVTKSVLVNRFIALAFLPNPDGLPEVNHIDGDKRNNAVSNLEWASRKANERHSFKTGLKSTRGSANGRAKLTAADVLQIRSRGPEGAVKLAAEYGVTLATIDNVLKGKTWAHV